MAKVRKKIGERDCLEKANIWYRVSLPEYGIFSAERNYTKQISPLDSHSNQFPSFAIAVSQHVIQS
jgi:hypothetical protein